MISDNALLVCHGEPPSAEILHHLWKQATLRIAVDGGNNLLKEQELVADCIIGDMDSVGSVESVPVIQIADQDTNDLAKAIQYCIEKEICDIHILGGAGKRSDHFLANLGVLSHYQHQANITLHTEDEQIQVIQGDWKAQLPLGTTLSLLPIYGPVSGLQSSGLQYPLPHEGMALDQFPLGLSNQVTHTNVTIQVTQGKLLLVLQQSILGKSVDSNDSETLRHAGKSNA